MGSIAIAVLALAVVALAAALVWALVAATKAKLALERSEIVGRELDMARKEAIDAQVKALETRFGELAATQLAERQSSLVNLNAQNVGNLFKSLKESLQKYEKEIEEAKSETSNSAKRLDANVRELQRFADEARAFTAALKGGNKIQGNKGEEILASLLAESGFTEGREYDQQIGSQSDAGRPDLCIYDALGTNAIYVDAKMNIKDFIDAYNMPDDEMRRPEKKAALARHVTRIKKQIQDLSDKDYPHTVKPKKEGYAPLPLVAMFCPFNAVLEAALQEEPSLMHFAFERNIVLVTPTTLWGYLLLVSHGWRRVEAERKIEDIQALGGKVVEKIDELMQDILNIGAALEKATESYERLSKHAGEKGQMSVKRVAEELMGYGVSPSKKLKAVGAAER